MKYEMSNKWWEYTDNVIYDLLNFLNLKMDSDKDAEIWYSDLDYPDTTKLGSLFDEDQSLFFCNCDVNISLVRLDNNKLLIIGSSSYEHRTYFVFALHNNADKFNIIINKCKKSVELNNDKGEIFSYQSIYDNSLKRLPNKFRIINLKSVSLEQLFERGQSSKEKVKSNTL